MADEVKPGQETGTPAERPEWLPERYETPEQLAKAYAEAERKITELSERAKYADSLEENYTALSAQVEQLQQAQSQQTGAADPLIAAYQSAMENGDYTSALAIQAQVSTMAATAAVEKALPQVNQQVQRLGQSQEQEIAIVAKNNLRAQYGEAFSQEVEATMHDLLVANPNLYPDQARYDVNAAAAAFDNVYKIATYGKQPTAATLDTTQMKELAQTATGAGGRALSPDEAKAEWDAVKASAPKQYWQ